MPFGHLSVIFQNIARKHPITKMNLKLFRLQFYFALFSQCFALFLCQQNHLNRQIHSFQIQFEMWNALSHIFYSNNIRKFSVCILYSIAHPQFPFFDNFVNPPSLCSTPLPSLTVEDDIVQPAPANPLITYDVYGDPHSDAEEDWGQPWVSDSDSDEGFLSDRSYQPFDWAAWRENDSESESIDEDWVAHQPNPYGWIPSGTPK